MVIDIDGDGVWNTVMDISVLESGKISMGVKNLVYGVIGNLVWDSVKDSVYYSIRGEE